MPDMTPWSVTATAGMSSSAARRTMSLIWVSPSSSEYSVWLCKWTNAIVSPFDKVGGARISVVVWLCALCRVMLGRKRAADVRTSPLLRFPFDRSQVSSFSRLP